MVYDFWKARKSTMTEEDRAWRTSEFVKFTNEYDNRRGKDFKSNFPELTGWI
jgi:hypothetical protein